MHITSIRERNLWVLAGISTVAVFSTLGPTLAFASSMRGRGIDVILFWIGFILVFTTIATHGMRIRPRGFDLALSTGTGAVLILVGLRLAFMDAAERTHLLEYGVIAIFIHAALRERQRGGGKVRWPGLLAIFITVAIGALDEGLQAVLPQRVFDPVDLLFNTLAALGSVTAAGALGWLRRRFGQKAHG